MRIAIFDYRIIQTNPIGGCHLRSITGLSGDHRFTVFAVEFENPDPARVDWVRIPAPRRPLALLFLIYHILAPIWYLAYRLRKGVKFDIIQIVESNLSFGNVAYSQFCHRAYLLNHWKRSRPTGLRGLLRLLDHALHAALEPLVYGRVRQIVVPSAGLARELSAVYPKVSNKVRVLANPVDIEKLQIPEHFDRQAERDRLRVEPTDVMLVFAALGQFERKGLPVVLEAIKQLNVPRIKLYVVGGEPDLVRSYEKRVRLLGLDGVVTFAGSQRDVRPYLWAADAFVLPSFYETFSLVSFEAAAAGLPLIVARLHGVEDLMMSNDCGFVVEPTPAAVAAAVAKFVALDTESRMMLGSTAKRSAAQYSTGNFVEAWRVFYSTAGPARPVSRTPTRSRLVTQKLPPIRITSSSESRADLPPLTGLRGVAAMWVVLFYFGPAFGTLVPATLIASPLTSKGFYGADLFFILSGFILMYNYFRKFAWTPAGYVEFLKNRFARIYPVHCVTLLALAVMVMVTHAGRVSITDAHYGAREFVYNLFLVQSWGLTNGTSWNYPAWSLSAEWFAYVLVFPLSWLLLKRVRTRIPLVLTIIAAICGYALLSPTRTVAGFQPLYQVVAEFFAGCCLCRLGDLWKLSERASTRLVNASAALLIAFTAAGAPSHVSAAPIMLFGSLILGLSKSRGAVARLLGDRRVVYLGATSFGLYMTQAIFQKVVNAAGGPEIFVSAPLLVRWTMIVLFLVSMLLIASFVYHVIEKPARGWMRRMMKTRTLVDFAIAGSNRGSERPPLRSTVG